MAVFFFVHGWGIRPSLLSDAECGLRWLVGLLGEQLWGTRFSSFDSIHSFERVESDGGPAHLRHVRHRPTPTASANARKPCQGMAGWFFGGWPTASLAPRFVWSPYSHLFFCKVRQDQLIIRTRRCCRLGAPTRTMLFTSCFPPIAVDINTGRASPCGMLHKVPAIQDQ